MKKYVITLAVFFILQSVLIFSGCATNPSPQVQYSKPKDITQTIPEELKSSSGPKQLVVFVGMENKSIYASDKLWDIASHLLTTRLMEIGYFSVIDWGRMKQNFDKLSLESGSLVNSPSDFADVRNKLSCDLFLGGAITYYDVSQTAQVSAISKNKTMTTTVRVDLWLQNAKNGEYVSAASGSGQATQQFTGGLLGGNIGTWDINVANNALNLAIDEALIKMVTDYKNRPTHSKSTDMASYYSQNSQKQDQNKNNVYSQSQIEGDSLNQNQGDDQTQAQPPNSGDNTSLSLANQLDNPSGFKRIGNKWAIVVGVSKFMDKRISALDYTSKDAMAVYNYLVDPNYGRFIPQQVFLLIDDKATTFNIKLSLDIISKYAKPEDMVTIYISSHGTPGGMDVEGVTYMATYDTLIDSLYATAFNMSELISAVNSRIKAKTVITLADTCYSAAAYKKVKFLNVRGAKNLVVVDSSGGSSIQKEMVKNSLNHSNLGVSANTVRRMSSATGRVFIGSSRANERSWESDTLKHGFFTYYLLEALKIKGGDVSIQTAFQYIQSKVPTEVKREKGESQHPVLGISKVKGGIKLGI